MDMDERSFSNTPRASASDDQMATMNESNQIRNYDPFMQTVQVTQKS